MHLFRKSHDETSTDMIALSAVIVAMAGGWCYDGFSSQLGTLSRLMLLGSCLAVAIGAIVKIRRTGRQRSDQLHAYLDLLGKLDEKTFSARPTPESFAKINASGPLGSSLDRLRSHWGEMATNVQEADQARARAEVRSRKAVGDSKQLLDIVENLTDAIVAVDNYDEITLANSAARNLLGLGEDIEECLSIDKAIPFQDLVNLIVETRNRKSAARKIAELEFPDEEGQSGWYEATVRSLDTSKPGDEAGRTNKGLITVIRDINKQKKIQKRNAEFVSSVSHEMKTPLAGIKAYVELLLDGDAEDDATREDFLGIINSQANRLQRLIENLLNLARIEAGVVEVDKQPHSLNEILVEAVGVIQHSADKKEMDLVCDLSPMYLGALVDRDMVLQSAINLLSNAIKYTAEGGTVTLRSRMESKEVQFSVSDTGVGLSEEDCRRVFEKFYRVHKDSNMAPGTGLGLPLARHIVEDVHGGRLTLESAVGEGSTFCVHLPWADQLATPRTDEKQVSTA